MQTKKVELDVDYIGGQESLTKKEEAALSAYIRSRQLTSPKKVKSRILKKEMELV
jgi:hypothetical protein